MTKFKIKFVFNGLPDTFCVSHGTLPYPSTKVDRQPLLFETEDLAKKFVDHLLAQYNDVDYEVVTADTYIPILRDKRLIQERNKQVEVKA